MKVMKIFIGFMIFSAVLATNARGAVIYEQGINNVFGGQNTFINRFAYDDFTLGTGYTLDKITINAFAHLDRFHRAEIRDMDWEIRSVAGTTPGGLLFSGNIGTVLRADTGVDSWGWDLVDYTIDIADIDLTVGSYFLGVKANDADDVHLTLLYDPVNITGALLKSTGPGYETYHTGKDYAFRLDGIATAPVPEPSTIALLGIGIVGLAGGAVRRRLKKTK